MAASACSHNAERLKREYVQRGDRYVKENNLDAAIIEYRNAIQQDGRFSEAYQKLASAYMNRGDGPNAFRAAITAADLAPDVADAQIQAGNMLLLAGKFDDAKARARKVLSSNADNARARVILASAMAGLKDVDTAIKEFEEAIRLDPQQAGAYTSLAALKATSGDREAAEQTFKQAIATDPKSITARLALAQFYWSVERLKDAEGTMKDAIGVAPADARANGSLAIFYQYTGRRPEAEPYLRKAADSDPNGGSTIRLADYYIAQNRPADAVPLLRRVTENARLAGVASIRLAELAQIDGREDEAIEIIDLALKAEPRNAMALVAKADLLRRQRKLDEALKVADAAAAADSSSASARFVKGKVLVAKGRLDVAEQAFNDTLRLNPRAAAAQVEIARLHMRAQSSDAVALATKATESDPRNLDARLTLARALMQKHDYAQAQSTLEALLRAVPGAAVVHAQLGSVLAMKKDAAGARESFNRAIERDPLQLEAIQGLMALDFKAQRPQEAIARIDALLGRAPKNPGLLMIAAGAYAFVNDIARAEAVLVKAIEVDPSLLPAYSALGRVYLSQRRLDAARTQFEKIVATQDRPVGALTLIGMIYQIQNKVPDAQKAFERVLTLDPRAGVAANNLAWIYAENGGSLDVALQLAQTAKAAMPDQPDVNDTLGWVYFKKDMVPFAIAALQRSLELDPKNVAASYHLALAYEKSGDRAGARRMMEQYLKLDPSSERSTEVKRRLQALGA
jgi:tetratricopeptide (TPR) repeat protein